MWETAWGRQLTDDNVSDEMSYEGKVFRRRFRMPYAQFQELLEHCKEHNIFGSSRKIPVEFKVLIGLRILGRGSCLDAVQEVTNVGIATINNIFKQFVNGCATHIYKDYVSIPEGEELRKVKEEYSRLGLPGCVGSMDVTHVQWGQCPYILRNNSIGKDKKPTLAFQVVVDHTRKIHHVSKEFFGRFNDKQITANDTYPLDLWHGVAHENETFTTIDAARTLQLEQEDDEHVQPIAPVHADRHIRWSPMNHERLRSALIAHFTKVRQQGKVFWPKRFKKWQRDAHPRTTAGQMAMQRANQIMYTFLYKAPSELRRLNPSTQEYSIHIGFGLFCSNDIRKGQRIADFNGEVISEEEYLSRTEEGLGGYIIQLRLGLTTQENKPLYLDCYANAHANLCKASMANSPHKVRFADNPGVVPTANAELKIYHNGINSIVF